MLTSYLTENIVCQKTKHLMLYKETRCLLRRSYVIKQCDVWKNVGDSFGYLWALNWVFCSDLHIWFRTVKREDSRIMNSFRKCVQGWEFVYRLGNLCVGLGISVQGWEFVYRVGNQCIGLGICVQVWEFVYRVGKLCIGLGISVQVWEFVCRVGNQCIVLGIRVQGWELQCIGLGICVQGWEFVSCCHTAKQK